MSGVATGVSGGYKAYLIFMYESREYMSESNINALIIIIMSKDCDKIQKNVYQKFVQIVTD